MAGKNLPTRKSSRSQQSVVVTETSSCKKCKKNLEELELYLTCDFCEGKFHTVCMKINSTNFKKIMKQPFWFCAKICENEFKKSKEPENGHIFEKENPTLKDVMNQLREYQNSFQYMSNIFDENKKVLEENSRVLDEISILRNDYIAIKKELSYVKYELNQFKQEKLKNNLIVYGIRNVENQEENETVLKEKFCSALKDANVIISKEDINSCYRIHGKQKNGPVIIELQKEEKKIFILKNKKALRSKNSNEFISVNEHLTSFSYKLLLEARIKLSGLFKYIWTRNGKILIKKNDDGSKPYEIFDFDDISYYLN